MPEATITHQQRAAAVAKLRHMAETSDRMADESPRPALVRAYTTDAAAFRLSADALERLP